MKAARLAQWILLGLASIGAVVLVLCFARLALEAPGDVPEAGAGWTELLRTIPDANEPAEYQDQFLFDGSPPSPDAKDFFAVSNRFVADSAVLMLLGLLGYGFVAAAIARRPSGRFAPLAVLGTGGAILAGYWLFGFNTSYPMDFNAGGLLPGSLGSPLLPGDPAFADPFDYGLAFTVWTDFFYQAAFAISAGVFVIGLMAGRFRTPLVVLAAIVTGSFGFPITTSWHWGGGWLSDLGAMDFGGSGSVHLLAGGTGLALVVLARLCPPLAPWQMHTMTPGVPIRRDLPKVRIAPLGFVVLTIGFVAFLLLPIGMLAGSVLSMDSPVVASVLHNTLVCIGVAVATAAAISIPLARRPRGAILFIAALAGLAAICAPADVVHAGQSAILGLIVGATSALLLWTCDRFGFDDPLGLVAAHLVGGVLGMITAGLVSPDTTLLVQLIASAAFAALGITIGICVGLLGWMIGLLWTPDEQSEPPPLPDVAQS